MHSPHWVLMVSLSFEDALGNLLDSIDGTFTPKQRCIWTLHKLTKVSVSPSW